ncbi:MAG: histidine phosphatase family protein [Candidatus Nanoarchaeia archaeon]
MIIYLVRHGESVANVERISAGHFNSPLTQSGIEQAKRVGMRFRDINDFEVIYTSDLDRAYTTAKEIHKFHQDKELISHSGLREKYFGEFEGVSFEITQQKYPGPAIFWNIESGESFDKHKVRVESVIEEILRIGKDCVIVNHGLTIKMILHILKAAQDEEYIFKLKSKNTAVYKVEITPKGVKMLLENCVKHLEE